jgi:hypothetical protein
LSVDSEFLKRLDHALRDIDYIAKWINVQKGVLDCGSAINDAYDGFVAGLEDELAMLELSAASPPQQRRIQGPEYHYRRSVLLFALMMAKIYAAFYDMPKSVAKIEACFERANKL